MKTLENKNQERVRLDFIIKSNPSLFHVQFKGYEGGKVVLTEPTEGALKKAKRDLDLFNERQQAIYDRKTIAEGDWVILKDGTASRVTVAGWPNDVQIGGLSSGSYYINSNGRGSYSGSCGDMIPREGLIDTGEYREGHCWLFSDNSSGGGRGVHSILNFKVFKQS